MVQPASYPDAEKSNIIDNGWMDGWFMVLIKSLCNSTTLNWQDGSLNWAVQGIVFRLLLVLKYDNSHNVISNHLPVFRSDAWLQLSQSHVKLNWNGTQ